jgi:hypothetical protein
MLAVVSGVSSYSVGARGRRFSTLHGVVLGKMRPGAKTPYANSGTATSGSESLSDIILRMRRLEGWPQALRSAAILRDASFGRSSG